MSEELLTSAFTNLRRRFRALAGRILQDDDRVDDALQEAFCRLWVRRDTIRTQQQAEALATTTLRNLSIDMVRRATTHPSLPLDEERDAVPDDEDCGEREALFREIEALVHSRLTETQQYILRRKEYDGATLEEVADELNMQAAAVRMQLSRARQKIRMCYLQRHS